MYVYMYVCEHVHACAPFQEISLVLCGDARLLYVCMYVCACVSVCTSVNMYMCVHICKKSAVYHVQMLDSFMYVYVCMHVCLYE